MGAPVGKASRSNCRPEEPVTRTHLHLLALLLILAAIWAA